jgi:hypothetical protein
VYPVAFLPSQDLREQRSVRIFRISFHCIGLPLFLTPCADIDPSPMTPVHGVSQTARRLGNLH